jgi:hypothetical protein
MTPDELRELEVWARAWAQAGSSTATLALKLLDAYREQLKLNVAAGERIAAQYELLSKRAEVSR